MCLYIICPSWLFLFLIPGGYSWGFTSFYLVKPASHESPIAVARRTAASRSYDRRAVVVCFGTMSHPGDLQIRPSNIKDLFRGCLWLLHKLCSTNSTIEQFKKKLEFVYYLSQLYPFFSNWVRGAETVWLKKRGAKSPKHPLRVRIRCFMVRFSFSQLFCFF